MAQSQLEKDVDCNKCFYQLDFVDSKHWPKICPVCGRTNEDLLKFEDRYYAEAE